MLAGIILVCLLNIWVTFGEIPPSFILNVLSDCNKNWPTNAVVEIATDLSSQVFIECSDGTLEEVPREDDMVHYFAKVYKQSSDGCAFRSPAGSEVYHTVVRVLWGYPSFDTFSEEERYTITCTFDKKGDDTSSSRQISEPFHAPEELAYHHGTSSSDSIDVKVVDIMGTELSGSIHLGRKVQLLVSVTGAGKGIRPITCSAFGTTDGASAPILLAGCGDGVALKQTAGFTVKDTTATSPVFDFFKIPDNTDLKFICNVTICSAACDGSTCPTRRKKRYLAELLDNSEGTRIATSRIYSHIPKSRHVLSSSVTRKTIKLSSHDLSSSITRKNIKLSSHDKNYLDKPIRKTFFLRPTSGERFSDWISKNTLNVKGASTHAWTENKMKVLGPELDLGGIKVKQTEKQEELKIDRIWTIVYIDLCIVILSLAIGLVACIKIGPHRGIWMKRKIDSIDLLVPYLTTSDKSKGSCPSSCNGTPNCCCQGTSDVKLDYFPRTSVDSNCQTTVNYNYKDLITPELKTSKFKSALPWVLNGSVLPIDSKCPCGPSCDCKPKCGCPFLTAGYVPDVDSKCPCSPDCDCKPKCGCTLMVDYEPGGEAICPGVPNCVCSPKCACPFMNDCSVPEVNSQCPCDPSCHCKPTCGCRSIVSKTENPLAVASDMKSSTETSSDLQMRFSVGKPICSSQIASSPKSLAAMSSAKVPSSPVKLQSDPDLSCHNENPCAIKSDPDIRLLPDDVSDGHSQISAITKTDVKIDNRDLPESRC